MLSLKSRPQSFFNRVVLFNTFTLVLLVLLVFAGSLYLEWRRSLIQEHESLKSKVLTVFRGREEDRLNSRFNKIAHELWGIDGVVGVSLFAEDCTSLYSVPENFKDKIDCPLNKDRWGVKEFTVHDDLSPLESIVISHSSSAMGYFQKKAQLVFVFLTLLFFVTLLVQYAVLRKYVGLPLKKIVGVLRGFESWNTPDGRGLPVEFASLEVELYEARERLLKIEQLRHQQVVSDELVKLSAKVAHDIRSPLAALKALVDNSIGEQERNDMLKKVVKRINIIADELLEKNRQKNNSTSFACSSGEIFTTIDEIIAEKKLEHQIKKVDYQFKKQIHAKLALAIDQDKFAAIVSNVLNNSAQSFRSSSDNKIVIHTSVVGGKLVIAITDNGSGIPQRILQRIGKEQVTGQKKEGNGIGLFTASQLLESWGGRLTVNSKVGQGTQVQLILPIISP